MYQRKNPFYIECGIKIQIEVRSRQWKSGIYQELDNGHNSPSETHRFFDEASPRVIDQQLKELEYYGIISKVIYPKVPPHTEYSLTETGKTLLPIIEQLELWGDYFRPEMIKRLDNENESEVY